MASADRAAPFEDVADGLVAFDPETGEILAANGAFRELTGYGESELVGADLSLLAAGGSGGGVDDRRVRRARTEGAARFEWLVETRSGEELPVDVNLTTTDRDGAEVALASVRETREPAGPGGERELYRTLADNNRIVLRELDLSAAKRYVDGLADDPEALRATFDERPETLARALNEIDVRDVNAKALEFYGAESERELVENLDRLVTEASVETMKGLWLSVFRDETGFRKECQVRAFDGRLRHEILDMTVPEACADDYSRVYLTGVDITERKERERALERSRDRYRTLFEDNPIVLWEFDLSEGRRAAERLAAEVDDLVAHFDEHPEALDELLGHVEVRDVNERAVEFYGASSKREVMTNLGQLMTEKSREMWKRLWAHVVEDGNDFRTDCTTWTLDGDLRTILTELMVPDAHADDYARVYMTGVDITERKERERELETLAKRFEFALEETDTGVWESELDPDVGLWERDLDEDDAYWSDASKRLYGYDPDEFPGPVEAMTDRIVDADLPKVERQVERAIEGDGVAQAEFRIELPDGSRRWLLSRALVEDGDESARMLGVHTDITERKERERELRRLKQEYQIVFEHAQDSLFLVDVDRSAGDGDPEFRIRHVNPANERVLEPTNPAVRGSTPREILGEDEGAKVEANYRRCLEYGGTISYEEELSLNGETRTFQTTLSPVEVDGEVTQIVGVAHEITERKERERELERKNEFLDEFASVVSHDIATPLAVIENKARLIEMTDDPSHAADIYDATERVRELVDELRSLAREGKRVGETGPVDLAEVTREAWESVETGGASLVVETSGTVEASRDRLRQLLENLLRNSVEHGPAGGPAGPGDPVTVRVGTLPDGFYVADDGRGIGADDPERVFEQGYTTDQDGTGLGLAIVRRIAAGHGWSIEATESGEGGARFEIRTGE